jgi:hypothetical protein
VFESAVVLIAWLFFLVPSVFVLLVFVEVFGVPNAVWVCLNVF